MEKLSCFTTLALLFGVSACTTGDRDHVQAEAQQGAGMVTTQYICDNGKKVTFIRPSDIYQRTDVKARLVLDGVDVNMHRVRSASGVILASDDQDDSTRWLFKDDKTGTWTYREGKKDIVINCAVQ